MSILTEELIVFIFVLLSIPALVYSVEKISGRKIYNRLIILLIYVLLTSFYLDKVEIYYRNKILKGRESLEQEISDPRDWDPVSRFLFDRLTPLKK